MTLNLMFRLASPCTPVPPPPFPPPHVGCLLTRMMTPQSPPNNIMSHVGNHRRWTSLIMAVVTGTPCVQYIKSNKSLFISFPRPWHPESTWHPWYRHSYMYTTLLLTLLPKNTKDKCKCYQRAQISPRITPEYQLKLLLAVTPTKTVSLICTHNQMGLHPFNYKFNPFNRLLSLFEGDKFAGGPTNV